ncbi:glycosyltransferase family 2 protein [Winogradskyella sp. UBA3174]|uniref:glycosyltransferase family 2 protein n=1 Tax=Winogradskyella sp. UBA3174 TaxID=1947785 RepID=UPI0025DE8773|nr:glycosyltransferase family A protein [Winogradskyella sp. UBA3174]|tara:strand:+ start:62972 stop:63964 length:993 start_codon:yes stop_codon:yes gene_type:complete
MEEPLVSIIIPVYNRATILKGTIDSIIAQTYKSFECIVIDDGSTDETFAELLKFQELDARIKPFKRPKNKLKGGNACRNYGFEMSKGTYIVWFDSDDLMHENYLESQVTALKNSKSNFCVCNSTWKTMTGRIKEGFRSSKIKSNDVINDYIQFIIFWHINAVCYKSEFLKNHSLQFDETLQQSQEYDFHVRVLRIDKNYKIVEQHLVTIIASENSISYSDNNIYKKTVSSLKVKKRFLSYSQENVLKLQTKKFLLTDIHNVFQQQTMKKNTRISIYSAYAYLSAHLTDKKIFKNYFFKHLIPVLTITIAYNLFGIGYKLFKKSNTFNYVK